MSNPRRIHIASRCYVQNFGVGDEVEILDKTTGDRELRNPVSVAWRNKWWGRDGQLSKDVESRLEKCENASAEILPEFAQHWPLSRTDQATIAQFAAIHTVRGPAWQDEWVRASSQAVGDAAARQSRRRTRADLVLRDLIESRETDTLRWVSVGDGVAAG